MLFLSGAYDAGTHAPSGALAPGECWDEASAPSIPLFSPGTPVLFTTWRVAATADVADASLAARSQELMKIALVAEDATPLFHATSNQPATQETRVAALASELARQDHDVTVYARKDGADLPDTDKLPGGAIVEYVAAGPAEPLADEAVLPHIRTFADALAAQWQDDRPDVVHAIGWTGGLAALAATRDRKIPVVQTFHSLRAAERRHRIADDGCTLAEHATTATGARDRLERAVPRSADLVIATNEDEVSDLAGLGVPRSGISVLPSGAKCSASTPEGPIAP